MKKLFLLPLLTLALSACGGALAPTPATIDINGKWVAKLGGPVSAVYRLTLIQSGNSVTGDAEIADYVGTFLNTYKPYGKVSGSVSGDQFSISSSGVGDFGGSVSLNGTRIADQLTGTWSGVGVNGSTVSGTFTASK